MGLDVVVVELWSASRRVLLLARVLFNIEGIMVVTLPCDVLFCCWRVVVIIGGNGDDIIIIIISGGGLF